MYSIQTINISINRGYLPLLSFVTKKNSKDIELDRDDEDLPERYPMLRSVFGKTARWF